MATERHDDEILEGFLAAGRSGPAPSPALVSRVLADAIAETARRESLRPAATRARPRRRLWVAAMAVIGGWPALAGMATAAATGVWVGFSSPDLVDGYISGNSPDAILEQLMPDFATLAGGG